MQISKCKMLSVNLSMLVGRLQEVKRSLENLRYASSVILTGSLNRMEIKQCGK